MDGFTTPKRLKAAAPIAAALAPRQQDAARSKPIPVSLPWETLYGREKIACIVPNVLSEEECEAIIQACEVVGFEKALLNVGGGRQVLATDVRKSQRCIVDDVEAAGVLWERLKHAIPSTVRDRFLIKDKDGWQCVGLNERFRVLKYLPGDYFAPHRDGSFERPRGAEPSPIGEPGDTSFFTLMLYLNEPAKGGGTNFIREGSYGDKDRVRPYNPRTGQALLFDHSIRHEGELLEVGVKYAVRTDVMYRRRV